ncbi:MAG: hypothetical protein DRG82_12285 [Deltaproteobacteria bacterium]|nr:MAG: hypothetical protein DRG82_12285 [Deltaproteobacteria bacterium]
MAEESRLIHMIRKKCAGEPYDVELYVNTMDRIMRSVFRVFARRNFPESDFGLESFMNFCWEKLENEQFAYKLSDLTFENDTHFLRYTRKIFENLLREKTAVFSPGFRARKKQLERVLKRACLSMCRKMCGCWKLAEFRTEICEPADADQLMEAAATIPTPELKPPKNPGERAPSIRDKEMARYLTTLLRAAGGMARHGDILTLLSRQFNLYTIRIEPMPVEEKHAELFRDQEVLLSPDHELMAKEIFGGMDSDMVDVHYYRVAVEMTIAETARQTGWSAGTVYNRERRYKEYLRSYFNRKGEFATPEEMEAVMQIVSKEVLAKKESQ